MTSATTNPPKPQTKPTLKKPKPHSDSSNSKDSLSTRLIIILKRLYEGECIKADLLASEFGTSLRTIQRDISHIANLLSIKYDKGTYQLDYYGGGECKSQIYQAICLYQRDRSTLPHARWVFCLWFARWWWEVPTHCQRTIWKASNTALWDTQRSDWSPPHTPLHL